MGSGRAPRACLLRDTDSLHSWGQGDRIQQDSRAGHSCVLPPQHSPEALLMAPLWRARTPFIRAAVLSVLTAVEVTKCWH